MNTKKEISAFGKEMRRIRNALKLSVRALSDKAKVSHSYLSQVENGDRPTPSPEIIKKIANALEYDYYALMRIAGYMDKDHELINTLRAQAMDFEKSLDGLLFAEKSLLNLIKEVKEDSKRHLELQSELNNVQKSIIEVKKELHVLEVRIQDIEHENIILSEVKDTLDGIADRRNQNIELVFQYPKWEWVKGDSPHEKVESEILPEEARQRFLYLENLLTMDENIYLNKRALSKQEKEKALKILKLVFENETEY